MIKLIRKDNYFKTRTNIINMIKNLFLNDDSKIANADETIKHLDYIFSNDNNDAFLLLNIENNKLLCMVNFLEHNNIKKEWSLFSVFTNKEKRRKGYAIELIKIGINEVIKNNGSIIISGIEKNNISSRKLHEKLGFIYEGKEWNQYALGFPENHLGYILRVDIINNLHTTTLGNERIKKNLNINEDVVLYCKNKILDKNSVIYKKGKNWYCEIDNIIITINSNSYTIITAHRIKNEKR